MQHPSRLRHGGFGATVDAAFAASPARSIFVLFSFVAIVMPTPECWGVRKKGLSGVGLRLARDYAESVDSESKQDKL